LMQMTWESLPAGGLRGLNSKVGIFCVSP